jgi:hypothetical protein
MVFTKNQAIACLVEVALGGRLSQFSSTHNQNEYHQFDVSQQQTPCVERVARVWPLVTALHPRDLRLFRQA